MLSGPHTSKQLLEKQLKLKFERLYLRWRRAKLRCRNATMCMKVCDFSQAILEMMKAILQAAAGLGDNLRERFLPEQWWYVIQHGTHQ
jgi:hypothetical protein